MFHYVVIKILQLFLPPMSILLETVVGANACKYSRDQNLNVPSEARHLLKLICLKILPSLILLRREVN
jgi:hypothetical protein